MALSFTGTSPPDFLPTEEETEIYREKIKRHSEPSSPSKKFRPSDNLWYRNCVWDEWDELGRNLTATKTRQAKVPWVKVKYVKGRLYIPSDQKEILRSLNLL
jgi:hypothetical protein